MEDYYGKIRVVVAIYGFYPVDEKLDIQVAVIVKNKALQ
jgi:hypothetical protein